MTCFFTDGDATCILPDEHDGPHELTPDDEILVSLVTQDSHTIPHDFDLDKSAGFLIGRLSVKRKRSWWRLGRKVWRRVSPVKEGNREHK